MMKRICIHWTAGSYTNKEPRSYHFTVGPNGEVDAGALPPEANLPPLTGDYVAHCGGGNTATIGVAMRGMAGFKSPNIVGPYPLTAKQCEAMWKLIAQLCKKYGIPISPDTVYTHYEFGLQNPKTTSKGKIDIIHLPHEPRLGPNEVGAYIRSKVRWYLERL